MAWKERSLYAPRESHCLALLDRNDTKQSRHFGRVDQGISARLAANTRLLKLTSFHSPAEGRDVNATTRRRPPEKVSVSRQARSVAIGPLGQKHALGAYVFKGSLVLAMKTDLRTTAPRCSLSAQVPTSLARFLAPPTASRRHAGMMAAW
jgi:hypothetical protein